MRKKTEIDPFLQLPLDHSMPFQHSLPRQSRQRNRLIHRRPKNTKLSHQGRSNSGAVFISPERGGRDSEVTFVRNYLLLTLLT
jgi:hypothetical protein